MWYLIVLLMWRLVTPILKLHWLFLPLSVVVSVLGGFWNTDLLMLPRFLGLLPFFVLGLHLKARHLAHLDDVWVRVAAVPALVGMAVAALFTDEWAQTAFLWYDAGYEDVGIDPVIAFQTRLTVMVLGLVGAFSVLALVPRRSLGWFTVMGGATMVVYLFHGFVIKTVKALGWPDFAAGAHHHRLRPHHDRCRAARPAAGLPARTPRARALHQPARLAGVPPAPARLRRRRRPPRDAPATVRPVGSPVGGPHVGGTAERGTESRSRGLETRRRRSRPGEPGATAPARRGAAGGAAAPAAPPAATSADDRGPASTR